MRQYFIRLGSVKKLLLFITILFVICFQVYWLSSDYFLRKGQIIKLVESEMSNQITLNGLRQLSGMIRINKVDSSYQLDLQSVLDSSRTPDHKNEISLDDTGKTSARSIEIELKKASQNITDETQLASMHSAIQQVLEKTGQGLSVYIKYSDGQKSFYYPNTIKQWKDNNNTQTIQSDFNAAFTYQAHITGLALAILRSMAVPILLSLLYVSLFLVTMFVLLRTIRTNRYLEAARNNLTHNITHELKIPISTLLIATEALDKYNGLDNKEEAKKYIGFIYTGIERISKLVDAILTTARMQVQNIRLNIEAGNLRQLMEEVLERLRLLSEQKDSVIDISGIDPEITIAADKNHLMQIFQNIIDNSLKYCAVTPLIHISASVAEGNMVLTFRDNGIGIPPESLTDVFQPYFRVPEADLHTVKGYGLGLSYVRSIVQLLGGEVRIVKSTRNGTTLVITLPFTDATS